MTNARRFYRLQLALAASGALAARLCDRHLAELEMDIQPDRSHLLLLSLDRGENQWANDIDASAFKAQPDKVAGAATEKPGLKAHPEPTATTDNSLQDHFHVPKSRLGRHRLRDKR